MPVKFDFNNHCTLRTHDLGVQDQLIMKAISKLKTRNFWLSE